MSRPRLTLPGVVIDVVSGTIAGVSGPAMNHWQVQGAIVSLDPGASARYSLPASHRAFAYVLSGQIGIAGRLVRAGQTAWSDPLTRSGPAARSGPAVAQAKDSVLTLSVPERDEPCQVMIYSGQPLREPVAMGGPFVMNSRTEVARAYTDFQAGKFGALPRQARLRYDR